MRRGQGPTAHHRTTHRCHGDGERWLTFCFVGSQREANLGKGQMWKDRVNTSNWPRESNKNNLVSRISRCAAHTSGVALSGVPLHPAVCRSHQRCGIQRCAAPTSGVPPPRSLAQAVPIFQNPLQKTLNRICFRPPLALFMLFN